MENIKELKKQAYDIATRTRTNGWDKTVYENTVDVRTEAMKAYALLVIAENSSKTNMED